jgi:ribonuclease Y
MEIALSLIIVVLLITGIVGFFRIKKKFSLEKLDIEEEQRRIIEAAEIKAETLIKEAQLEAKSRLLEMKAGFDAETQETREELKKEARRLSKKSEKLDQTEDLLTQKDTELQAKESEISEKLDAVARNEVYYNNLVEETRKELEKISGLTLEEARELLLKTMEEDARHEGAKLVKKVTTEAREQADKEAKKIISTAIQRYAGDFVAERTVSVVHLPGDEMKGRIIGREGRNIRALEAATGIDLIIDDGRIHPARIEDVVERAGKEVDVAIKEAGEQAAFDLGVHGINPELIMVLGKLKFRTSYAQNVLQHSFEVAFLAGVMAAELKLDVKLAKRMGLLHDIGKAVDHEVDGAHAIIGAKLAKKYGELDSVVNAIAAHHEDQPPTSVYDYLVQAADALSGARPGARKESLENYIKRLEDLEKIANSFDGVVNTYAIQAGREIRVITESEKISDEDAVLLSREIARQIEENLTFPGQVKVVVIRETRAVEYTKK